MDDRSPFHIQELVERIGHYLERSDWARCARVCKSWQDAFVPLLYHHITHCVSYRGRATPWIGVKTHGDLMRTLTVTSSIFPEVTLLGPGCHRLTTLIIEPYLAKGDPDLWGPRLSALIDLNPLIHTLRISLQSNLYRGIFGGDSNSSKQDDDGEDDDDDNDNDNDNDEEEGEEEEEKSEEKSENNDNDHNNHNNNILARLPALRNLTILNDRYPDATHSNGVFEAILEYGSQLTSLTYEVTEKRPKSVRDAEGRDAALDMDQETVVWPNMKALSVRDEDGHRELALLKRCPHLQHYKARGDRNDDNKALEVLTRHYAATGSGVETGLGIGRSIDTSAAAAATTTETMKTMTRKTRTIGRIGIDSTTTTTGLEHLEMTRMTGPMIEASLVELLKVSGTKKYSSGLKTFCATEAAVSETVTKTLLDEHARSLEKLVMIGTHWKGPFYLCQMVSRCARLRHLEITMWDIGPWLHDLVKATWICTELRVLRIRARPQDPASVVTETETETAVVVAAAVTAGEAAAIGGAEMTGTGIEVVDGAAAAAADGAEAPVPSGDDVDNTNDDNEGGDHDNHTNHNNTHDNHTNNDNTHNNHNNNNNDDENDNNDNNGSKSGTVADVDAPDAAASWRSFWKQIGALRHLESLRLRMEQVHPALTDTFLMEQEDIEQLCRLKRLEDLQVPSGSTYMTVDVRMELRRKLPRVRIF
ncbi:hypothetical protein B0O80DRAFT_445646 [Mortierella sp. GBAus27b]|nr:hypothetical protein BGX31_006755 [Mortierella sp. GBA43]KAI8357707.1 hypothetical protein B0O80DRAFT_445646 [Mortierella sp. GBAus27b]